jgi:hypothetical protein
VTPTTSNQPAVLFSHNKPTTSNQPAVLFSQKKPAPASHQPPTNRIGCIFASTLSSETLPSLLHHLLEEKMERHSGAREVKNDFVSVVSQSKFDEQLNTIWRNVELSWRDEIQKKQGWKEKTRHEVLVLH